MSKIIAEKNKTKIVKLLRFFWGDFSQYVPDAVNLFCQEIKRCCGTLLRYILTQPLKKERKNNYVRSLQRMLIHARGALFFIMTNLAAFSLYFFLYFEVWDLSSLKCSLWELFETSRPPKKVNHESSKQQPMQQQHRFCFFDSILYLSCWFWARIPFFRPKKKRE